VASGRKLITVGDVVTANALKFGLRPWAAIVDGRAMRKPLPNALKAPWRRRLVLRNPPSTISDEAWAIVGSAVREGDTLVLVDGEEDLLALLAISLGPEGAVVIYGQPGRGVVLVEINDSSKKMVGDIIKRMKKTR